MSTEKITFVENQAMAGNSFGKIFKLTTFGESHGTAIGGIIEGCPAGISIDFSKIQEDLNRRKPGQSRLVTQRKEDDEVEFLSGIFEGKSLGTPIGFIIKNTDQKPKDYSHIKGAYRPSHADFTYDEKYHIRDYRGGGRASARETACRVVAGAIAKQVIPQITIVAYTQSVGEVGFSSHDEIDLSEIKKNDVRCPNAVIAKQMEEHILAIKKSGDSIGGVIFCNITHVPAGLGEPVFDKLHAELGKAMLSINAVKGFEYGSGFEGTKMKGSQHNDLFNTDKTTKTNYSGGIQGGISNGNDIYFRVAFKPVATLMKNQPSIDREGNAIEIMGKGRHDACVVPRAVPIVEAMAALVLADYYLQQKINQ